MDAILQTLQFQTLAVSVAVLWVALLRRPLARCFDARAVYMLWLCVPLALAVAPLPSPLQVGSPRLLVLQGWMAATPGMPGAMAAPPATAGAAVPPAAIVVGAWACGAVLMAVALFQQQRRFGRLLQPAAGRNHWQLPAGAGACVVGVFPPRLALPADFSERFSQAERELILAHEAVHLHRHDNLWNLLAAACCCVQWFNPLCWWAWRRMRVDQELACDAVVLIERHPQAAVASYAQALVRSHEQAHRALLPTLASPWQPRSGLVDRVAQLQRHARRRGLRRHDRAPMLALLLMTAGGVSAAAALQGPQRASETASAEADALPADAPYGAAPHMLRWQLTVREAGRVAHESAQSLVLMPGQSPAGATSRHVEKNATGPLWCFETAGNRFADGSWRFSGRLLDAQCKDFLAEPREIKADGSALAFRGRLADGTPVAVELSARRHALPRNMVWLDVGISHNLRAEAPAGLRLLGPLGERLRVQAHPQSGPAADMLAVEIITTAEGEDLARIQARLLLGEPARVLAEPQLVTRWDMPAKLRWQDPASEQQVELAITPHRRIAQPGTR